MTAPRTLTGRAAAPGVAIGPALIYHLDASGDQAQPAADPATELDRLNSAIAAADTVIAGHEADLRAAGRDDEAEIFAAHRMMLDDPGLREQATLLIAGGLAAATAFSQAAEEQARELEAIDDEYLSARAADVRDVAAQVRRALSGEQTLGERLHGPTIIVAHDLGPSDLMSVPRDRLLGFALAAGGMTAHSSILARSLGIPAVVGLGDSVLELISDGMTLGIDGAAGQVQIDPPAAAQERLRDLIAQQAATRDLLRTQIDLPTVTGDGHPIMLLANAATAADARAAREWGAAGIGLLRTELLFLDRAELPDEQAQLALYQGRSNSGLISDRLNRWA